MRQVYIELEAAAVIYRTLAAHPDSLVAAKGERHDQANQRIPPWVARGKDERCQQVEERIPQLPGIFAARGMLPFEVKPARNVADLLVQRVNALEQEGQEEGKIQWLLADHFAKVHKVRLPLGGIA